LRNRGTRSRGPAPTAKRRGRCAAKKRGSCCDIRLAEAPSFGQSIFDYAPDSHGATDYQQLAEEVLGHGVAGHAAAAATAERG